MNRTILKTQMELSKVLIDIIDRYYSGRLEEEVALAELQRATLKNKDILFVGGDYGTIVVHKLGKKRMRVLREALNIQV